MPQAPLELFDIMKERDDCNLSFNFYLPTLDIESFSPKHWPPYLPTSVLESYP